MTPRPTLVRPEITRRSWVVRTRAFQHTGWWAHGDTPMCVMWRNAEHLTLYGDWRTWLTGLFDLVPDDLIAIAYDAHALATLVARTDPPTARWLCRQVDSLLGFDTSTH